MGGAHPRVTPEQDDSPPPSTIGTAGATCEPPSIGVNPTVALQPGETLVVFHPHSQCPMHVASTTELHDSRERTIRHDIKTSKASYAPFPTRADFEQAEIFINNDCPNKLIDQQLKFACRNGMHLEVNSSHKMHELLSHGVEEDFTDDSKVGSVWSACYDFSPHIPSFVRKR